MLYRYRLLFVIAFGLILLAIAYMYDVHPRFVHIANLKQTEDNLNEKLFAKKQPFYTVQPKKMIKVEPDNNILNHVSELIRLIRTSGLTAQSIELPPIKSDKSLRQAFIHIVLRGDYQQLAAFMSRMERRLNLFAVQNVSYKWTEKNDLLIAMDILPFNYAENKQLLNDSNILLAQFNPFCFANIMNKWMDDNNLNEALLAPIEQIKMVGYLQSGKYRQALVMLPNAVMRTVEIGFLLGSEKGEVITINKKQIIVKLPDERRVSLTLTAR